MAVTPTPSKPLPKPRPLWFFVTFIVLISALGSFVNDMFTPALPAMCRFFHVSIPTVQMGLTMGMVGLAVGQLFLGPLSDRYGRKPILIGSMSLFIVAAVVSVFSPTIEFFVSCRLFQGMGASGAYLLGRSMPADRYSGVQLAKIMALIGAINGVAPASAPVLGGVTADAWGWKGIFVVLACFAALLLIMAPFIRETLPPDRRFQGSWLKAFEGYKVLLVNKAFMVHVSLKGMALGLLFAYISAAPFILEDHYGMSQTRYGVVIGLNSLFLMVASMLATRFHPLKKGAWVGTWIIVAGVAVQAPLLWMVKSFWLFEAAMAVILFGMGLLFTVTNTLAMNEGRARAGEASSVLGIAGYIIGAIVSPLVGIGNVLHSTAVALVVMTALTLVFAYATRNINCDLDKNA